MKERHGRCQSPGGWAPGHCGWRHCAPGPRPPGTAALSGSRQLQALRQCPFRARDPRPGIPLHTFSAPASPAAAHHHPPWSRQTRLRRPLPPPWMIPALHLLLPTLILVIARPCCCRHPPLTDSPGAHPLFPRSRRPRSPPRQRLSLSLHPSIHLHMLLA